MGREEADDFSCGLDAGLPRRSMPQVVSVGAISCHRLVDVADPARLSEQSKERIITKFQGAELRWKPGDSIRAEHDRAGLDEIAGSQVAAVEPLATSRWSRKGTVYATRLLAVVERLSLAERTVRMRVEEVGLCLELSVAIPEIVPIKQRKVLPGHFRQDDLKYAPALAELILGLQDSSNATWIRFDILLNDLPSTIGGTVVMNEYLEWKVCLLCENAIESLANKWSVIVGEDADTDFERSSIHKRLVNSFLRQYHLSSTDYTGWIP